MSASTAAMPDRFRYITRHGDLAQVLGGIEAAQAAGLKVKINMVALKGLNEDEIEAMLRWCAGRGPRSDPDRDHAARRGRGGPHRPLSSARRGEAAARERFDADRRRLRRTGGPARYYEVAETGLRLGLITPLTGNFCTGCNRIRVPRRARSMAASARTRRSSCATCCARRPERGRRGARPADGGQAQGPRFPDRARRARRSPGI